MSKKPDEQYLYQAEVAKAEAAITDAIVNFYRNVGVKRDTINKILTTSGVRHKTAMKRAIAELLRDKMTPEEIRRLVGPIPG